MLSSLSAHGQTAFEVPVRGELLPGWQNADGTRTVAIRLSLEPGWKTYWRSPGEGGIPPRISWKKSRNLRSVAIIWPTPKVFIQSGMQSIGYEGELVLPMRLTPRRQSRGMALTAELDIGICRDICIPHQMVLTAEVSDQNAKVTPAIAAALAATPLSAKEAGLRGATCRIRPQADGLEVEARITLPSAGGEEVVVIEPGNENLWMSPTDSWREGGVLVAEGDLMSTDGKAIALDRSKLRITVIGKNHAVDIRGCEAG